MPKQDFLAYINGCGKIYPLRESTISSAGDLGLYNTGESELSIFMHLLIPHF